MSLSDENAWVLAQIAARGTDLSISRTIEFAHLLYSETTARQFAAAAENAGYQVEIKARSAAESHGRENVWDVYALLLMVPTAEQITRCEADLDGLARPLGGHADGWGFESS